MPNCAASTASFNSSGLVPYSSAIMIMSIMLLFAKSRSALLPPKIGNAFWYDLSPVPSPIYPRMLVRECLALCISLATVSPAELTPTMTARGRKRGKCMTCASRKRQVVKTGIANARKNNSNQGKVMNSTPRRRYESTIQKIHISTSANNAQHGLLKRFDA